MNHALKRSVSLSGLKGTTYNRRDGLFIKIGQKKTKQNQRICNETMHLIHKENAENSKSRKIKSGENERRVIKNMENLPKKRRCNEQMERPTTKKLRFSKVALRPFPNTDIFITHWLGTGIWQVIIGPKSLATALRLRVQSYCCFEL